MPGGQTTVGLFRRGNRSLAMSTAPFKRRRTIIDVHMPAAHGEVADRNADTSTTRAVAVGPRCAVLVECLLPRQRYPQQPFRGCSGLLDLGQKHGIARLEAAYALALRRTGPDAADATHPHAGHD